MTQRMKEKAQAAGRDTHSSEKRSPRSWLRRGGLSAVALLALVLSGAWHAQAQTYSVLHSFTLSATDGANPWAPLAVDSSGNLYGTTLMGGSSGQGTVFKLDPSGNETLLYNFGVTATDGALPYAGLLLDSNGNLYGTTYRGGSSGLGTVFKLDPSGNETLLHNFTGSDGANPIAGLVMDTSGNLYGTAYEGGSSGYAGTVFKLDPSGNETVLYNFGVAPVDGVNPWAGLLLDSSGNLYGTTITDNNLGNGTVFKLDPSGNETLLYQFTGSDGEFPYAPLLRDSSGNLYGTTYYGGASNGCGIGCGTVFKLDSSGNETVLHSFSGSDGANPYAGLVMDSAGNLYGTTSAGGSSGGGIVFKLDPSGNETVLHNFGATANDGTTPSAGLVMDSSGNLYGTTQSGGSSGEGTVYKLALSIPFSSFSPKLEITPGPPPGFHLSASLTPGTGAPAINPITQSVTLSVGTYTVTIPPGSFSALSTGSSLFQGNINGATLQFRISQNPAQGYLVQVDASGVDLTTLTNPVTVTLSIGQNTGTTNVTARF